MDLKAAQASKEVTILQVLQKLSTSITCICVFQIKQLKVLCALACMLCSLTVVVVSNDAVLSESEMAQQVRHQSVKWSWTVQNKQARWWHSLINWRTGAERRSVRMWKKESQTETESKERREGGGGGFSKGLTARPLQLLHYWSSAKWEQGQSLCKKGAHTEATSCICTQARQSGCLVDSLQDMMK